MLKKPSTPYLSLTLSASVVVFTFLARAAPGRARVQAACPPSAILPFSYYKLDEAQAAADPLSLADSGCAGAPATAHHTAADSQGKLKDAQGNPLPARALRAAQGAYVNFGNVPQFNGAKRLTIAAWVKFHTTTGQRAFVTKWGNPTQDAGNTLWTDFLEGKPRLAFLRGQFITSDVTFTPDNLWHHIAWVYDGAAPSTDATGAGRNAARLQLYVDGRQRTLTFGPSGSPYNVPAQLASNATNVILGSYNNGQGFSGLPFYIDASVDELGFWDNATGEALSANLYNADPRYSPSPSPTPTGRGLSYQTLLDADALHRGSLVLLAHSHTFLRYNYRGLDNSFDVDVDDFEEARAGGVTAMTAKLTVDGADWIRSVRVQCKLSAFGYNIKEPTETSPPGTCYTVSNGQPVPIDAADGWRPRFLDYLGRVQAVANDLGSGVVIVREADQIPALKANDQLGVIIGSEGANQLADLTGPANGPKTLVGNLAHIQTDYDAGWRETQLHWCQTCESAVFKKDQAGLLKLTTFGQQFLQKAESLGILIDVSHSTTDQINQVLQHTHAPLIRSHDAPINPGTSAELTPAIIDAVVKSGGGHGVIALHFCRCFHNPPVFENILRSIDYLKTSINGGSGGVDHVALGADYMPDVIQPEVPPVTELAHVTVGLMRLGYTEQEIKKVLGLNLLNLYRRVWRPFKGQPKLKLCSDAASNASSPPSSFDPDCVSAAINDGTGDMNHRPLNCLSAGGQARPTGLQLSYIGGHWKYYDNDSLAKPCADNSTLVATWPEPAGNAGFKICSDASNDDICAAAASNGGAGTNAARAVNCVAPQLNGVIGLQLSYANGWTYTNNLPPFNQLPCAGNSTLVAYWCDPGAPASWCGAGQSPGGQLRLCTDAGSDPNNLNGDAVCVAAGQQAGSGSNGVHAINCANSSIAQGQVGLHLTYQGGRWQYHDNNGNLRPCRDGTVLVEQPAP